MRAQTGERNNSILYLALLSLVYFLFASASQYILPAKEAAFDTGGKIYIEIDDGQGSVVKTLETSQKVIQINNSYNIDKILRSGDKLIIQSGKRAEVGRMSGLKSLSLGIPI
ncbi:MAG: hypothetical protein ACHQ6U_04545 [Thermodesulfobacteriota bacterium]